MFDVGFSEMLVIGIVALVVIGPERLPKVARTLGHLMGRAQRYVNDVKRDIDREMQIEELRKLQTEMQDAARSIETSVTAQVGEVKNELDKAQDTLNQFAEQTSDLTRLDDPLALKSDQQAAAAEAGADVSASSASVAGADGADGSAGGADETPTLLSSDVVQSPVTQSLPEPVLLSEPQAQHLPQVQPIAVAAGRAEPHVAAQAAVQDTRQVTEEAKVEPEQTTDNEPELLRHQVDHIVPDYSEGVMGPNTSISQPAPGTASQGGAAGAAARNVLVHVDVPPVT